MTTSIALLGLPGLVAAAEELFIPFNVASGALVTASSTSVTGACVSGRCAASNVIGLASNNATGQWVSAPGTCDVTRPESITIDWSQNFGVQYITEVRYRFGSYPAANANLVVYDTQPMNVNNPTAVTYINDEQWVVYVFEVPVTATSLSYTWTGLMSPDGGVSCQVSVRDIQVWTGPSPDGLGGVPKKNDISTGAVVGISIAIVVVLALAAVAVFVYCLRRKNLMNRNRTYELGPYGQRLADDDAEVDGEPLGGFEALSKRVVRSQRMRNYLATLGTQRPAPAQQYHQDAAIASAHTAAAV
ncbi:hypothetical protein HDU79_005812 [Rhizoclosmatium sp. JEL0117]|nr:hypothetical protein HDU79_005812 [Rhizoclosmatium sp. JEL0117]